MNKTSFRPIATIKSFFALLLAFSLIASPLALATPTRALGATVGGLITVDGNIDDWANVPERASSESKIDYWQIAKDADGNVYIGYTGTCISEWDTAPVSFSITQNGQTLNYSQYWYPSGCKFASVNTANGNTAGPYYAEIFIPADAFSNSDFSITFAGTTVSAADIEVLDGNEVADDTPAEYQGIVIDGKYKDWAPVAKTDIDGKNGAGQAQLESMALVFDGDVYVYVKEAPGGSASGAGTHSNGQYSITTDLGRQLLFQLNNDGTVSGVTGAEAKHVGSEWEIRIPASELPPRNDTISVGLYQQESVITNVSDLKGSTGGTFEGIVYDGLYDDWTYYPHTMIQYATAGTQEHVTDAEGALYMANDNIYGHVVTDMKAHLEEAGGEFTAAVMIKVNEDTNLMLGMRFVAVDKYGNINWNPTLLNLENGTYEFYITSTTVDGKSENIDDLKTDDVIYGKMMVTIADSSDECEFYLDCATLANNLHSNYGQSKETVSIDASDIEIVAAQFRRIGDEWIITSGTSSAPWAGVTLCIATVACVLGFMWYKSRRNEDASQAVEQTIQTGTK